MTKKSESIKKLNEQLADMGIDEIKDVEACPERTDYLLHLEEGDWKNDDWKKKLKQLEEAYLRNFYKQIHYLYPNLLFAIDIDGVFWNYNETLGVYEKIGYQSVRSIILRELRKEGLDKYTTEQHAKRILANYIAESGNGATLNDFVEEDGWLHVQNGWLNVDTLTLEPHSPVRRSLYTIGVAYDETALCPLFDKFLDEDVQMPKDQVRVIDQFSGLILTNDISHKEMLIFDGAPGCGKSMVAELWLEILQKKSTISDLSRLNGGAARFIGESLTNRTLCFFDEANPKTENINEFFQNLISGKYIKVEKKGVQDTEEVQNTLKIVLALNEMPHHMPAGFNRRYRHILFTRSFRAEGIEDKSLQKKIIDTELPGILNRMLRGLKDLKKMGTTTVILGEEERKRQFTLAADDLSAFISDHFEPDDSNEEHACIEGKKMLQAFKEEYPSNFNRGLSIHAFSKKLLSVNGRLSEFVNIRKERTKTYRGFAGLKFKDGHYFSSDGFESRIKVDVI